MGWADGVGAGVSVENGLGHQEFAGGCFARARRTMNNPASRAGGGFSRPERLNDFAGEGYPMLGVVFELGENVDCCYFLYVLCHYRLEYTNHYAFAFLHLVPLNFDN